MHASIWSFSISILDSQRGTWRTSIFRNTGIYVSPARITIAPLFTNCQVDQVWGQSWHSSVSYGSKTMRVTYWFETWVKSESNIMISVAKYPSPPSCRQILIFPCQFWLQQDAGEAGDRLVGVLSEIWHQQNVKRFENLRLSTGWLGWDHDIRTFDIDFSPCPMNSCTRCSRRSLWSRASSPEGLCWWVFDLRLQTINKPNLRNRRM